MKCPKGHEMHKKQDYNGIAIRCPKNCGENKNCPLNYEIENCCWCNKCQHHYRKDDRERVKLT